MVFLPCSKLDGRRPPAPARARAFRLKRYAADTVRGRHGGTLNGPMAVVGGAPLPVVRLIEDLAAGARQGVSGQELAAIREHVAAAGFSPSLLMPADLRVVGLVSPSGGSVPIARFDPVNVGELHYLRHVTAQQEWPIATRLADYYASGARLARDPRSGRPP